MKIATAQLSSVSPYSQSRYHATPKKDKESADAHERRTWRNRLHVNADGIVVIPQMALKNCLSEAAQYLAIKIPGKGNATYTKHFDAGVLVLEAASTGIEAEKVNSEELFLDANGKRNSGTRVVRIYPVIPEWSATATFPCPRRDGDGGHLPARAGASRHVHRDRPVPCSEPRVLRPVHGGRSAVGRELIAAAPRSTPLCHATLRDAAPCGASRPHAALRVALPRPATQRILETGPRRPEGSSPAGESGRGGFVGHVAPRGGDAAPGLFTSAQFVVGRPGAGRSRVRSFRRRARRRAGRGDRAGREAAAMKRLLDWLVPFVPWLFVAAVVLLIWCIAEGASR